MNQVISPLHRLRVCKSCVSRITTPETVGVYINKRCISSTVPLMRVKRQQRPYRPKLQPFENYGKTHRLARGQSMDFTRYGPLFDKPDYTFLDGRPSPLTPEQREEREKRKVMAERVLKDIKAIKNAKDFYIQKQEMDKAYMSEISKQRLKPKS